MLADHDLQVTEGGDGDVLGDEVGHPEPLGGGIGEQVLVVDHAGRAVRARCGGAVVDGELHGVDGVHAAVGVGVDLGDVEGAVQTDALRHLAELVGDVDEGLGPVGEHAQDHAVQEAVEGRARARDGVLDRAVADVLHDAVEDPGRWIGGIVGHVEDGVDDRADRARQPADHVELRGDGVAPLEDEGLVRVRAGGHRDRPRHRHGVALVVGGDDVEGGVAGPGDDVEVDLADRVGGAGGARERRAPAVTVDGEVDHPREGRAGEVVVADGERLARPILDEDLVIADDGEVGVSRLGLGRRGIARRSIRRPDAGGDDQQQREERPSTCNHALHRKLPRIASGTVSVQHAGQPGTGKHTA